MYNIICNILYAVQRRISCSTLQLSYYCVTSTGTAETEDKNMDIYEIRLMYVYNVRRSSY